MIEELDIAAAAINGVTMPAMANGTASTLYPTARPMFCATKRRARRATPSASATGDRSSP